MARPPFQVTEFIHYVTDLDAAIRQYVDGFGMNLVHREDWGFAVVEMQPGCVIGLMDNKHSDAEEGDIAIPRIGAQTTDLPAMRNHLAAAGFEVSEIIGPDDGTQAMNAYDSSGNAIFFWSDGSDLEGDES